MDIQAACYPQVFLLILTRVLAIVGGTAIFGRSLAPPKIRVGLAFGIAIVLTPVAPMAWVQACASLNTMPLLLPAILREVLLGAAIGLMCDLFISIFLVAGYVAGMSSSFTMAEVVDPVSGVSNNVLGQLFQLTFWMVILASNGHLLLLKLLFGSFQAIPPQSLWFNREMAGDMVAMGSQMFKWGFKLATPVVAAILIIDCAFGLISRMAPDFNILFLSLPVRLLVGLMVFGLTFRFGDTILLRLVEEMMAACARLLTE
jgi:flagellar biosynthetic protein FliR